MGQYARSALAGAGLGLALRHDGWTRTKADRLPALALGGAALLAGRRKLRRKWINLRRSAKGASASAGKAATGAVKGSAGDVVRAALMGFQADKLPERHAVITTTNEFAKLRAATKGRLESRFIRLPVDAPTATETARELVRRFRIPADKAHAIARGAVPEGMLDGCNFRAALNDAEAFVAVRSATRALNSQPSTLNFHR